jgi:hypothetical protein
MMRTDKLATKLDNAGGTGAAAPAVGRACWCRFLRSVKSRRWAPRTAKGLNATFCVMRHGTDGPDRFLPLRRAQRFSRRGLPSWPRQHSQATERRTPFDRPRALPSIRLEIVFPQKISHRYRTPFSPDSKFKHVLGHGKPSQHRPPRMFGTVANAH